MPPLSELRTDLPLVHGVADLRWTGVRADALETLCAELDDTSVLDRLPVP